MWEVRYAASVVQSDIPRLDAPIKQRIKHAIEAKLIHDPMRFGKPLRHSLHHLRSFRVGDYRVLYQLDMTSHSISIVAISHRKDVYDS